MACSGGGGGGTFHCQSFPYGGGGGGGGFFATWTKDVGNFKFHEMHRSTLESFPYSKGGWVQSFHMKLFPV